MPYSKSELLEEIQRVAAVADSDGAPTITEFTKHSDIADSTIHRRFGSWNEAVAAAGFTPNSPETAIPTDDLIAELHRLREDSGALPTGPQMNEEGAYSRSTYQKRFGSWKKALVAAFDDLEDTAAIESRVGRPQQHTDDALVEELHRIATEYHDPPRIKDIREHSNRGAKTYIRRFGSWNEALEAAGFESADPNRVSTDDLIADLHRLRDELGTQPTATDVVEEGAHGLATYQRRFGSWSTALGVAFEDSTQNES